jgi:hypothetical protein
VTILVRLHSGDDGAGLLPPVAAVYGNCFAREGYFGRQTQDENRGRIAVRMPGFSDSVMATIQSALRYIRVSEKGSRTATVKVHHALVDG